jgi:hypothetical protein
VSGLAKVDIKGLDEFRQSLKAMDAGTQKMMRLVFADAVGLVIDWARPRMPSKSGRARGSIKAQLGDRRSSIALGGSRAPWAPWLDFGGEGKRAGRPPKRPFIREGRYVYQGLKIKRAEVLEALSAGIDRLAREAGFEVD